MNSEFRDDWAHGIQRLTNQLHFDIERSKADPKWNAAFRKGFVDQAADFTKTHYERALLHGAYPPGSKAWKALDALTSEEDNDAFRREWRDESAKVYQRFRDTGDRQEYADGLADLARRLLTKYYLGGEAD